MSIFHCVRIIEHSLVSESQVWKFTHIALMFNNLKNFYSHEKNRTEHEVQVSSLQFSF